MNQPRKGEGVWVLVRQRICQQVDVDLSRILDFIPSAATAVAPCSRRIVQSVTGENQDDLAIQFQSLQGCLAGTLFAVQPVDVIHGVKDGMREIEAGQSDFGEDGADLGLEA